jgi:hypothetical protein
VAIWNILQPFGKFFPVLVCCTKKIWQPCNISQQLLFNSFKLRYFIKTFFISMRNKNWIRSYLFFGLFYCGGRGAELMRARMSVLSFAGKSEIIFKKCEK